MIVGKKYLLPGLLLMLFMQLQGQLISVQPEISSDSMMIGDQELYTLHVEAAGDVDFSMPLLQDTLGAKLEILALQSTDTVREGDRLLVDHTYLFTGFEGGMHMIPAPRVLYFYGDIMDTAVGMPIMMAVYEPEVDTTQAIRPIKAPINTPVSFREVLPWALLGLGIVLMGILVWFFIRLYLTKKRDPEGLLAAPREAAHILAFRELDALKEARLWESGEIKEYYTRLTEISRRYIERQYGIPAMESTSYEILQAFRKCNTGDVILDDMLKELLELADLVKFAKEAPLPLDNQTNLNNAYIFVQKTYPLFMGPEDKEDDAGAVEETVEEKEGDNG